jgi:hypothetical protein
LGDTERVHGGLTPWAVRAKGGESPPHGPGEPISRIRVRSRPALRVSQGTRGLRETGGPATRGKPLGGNRGRAHS